MEAQRGEHPLLAGHPAIARDLLLQGGFGTHGLTRSDQPVRRRGLRQFVSRPLPQCRARDLALPIRTGKVIGLAGVRRSGKT